MFDIHYHLLFGIDDGPKTLEDSLRMAEVSIAEGVTHIVCTPHANYRYAFQPELNRKQLAILNEHLGSRITLGLGCDLHLSYDNIEDTLSNPAKYTINGKRYLLVEFPDLVIPPSLSEWLYRFNAIGITPIITHPERNPRLVEDPSRMAVWMRSGCLVQVTAGSLAGRFGKRAAAMCDLLIKKNWVHFIASDAHSLNGRPPAMQEAWKIVKSRFGEETADRLCLHNPRAAFLGEDLPPQPEPIGLNEDWEPKQGFFRRLFGR
jgi:protein-tyrosine phosphatase